MFNNGNGFMELYAPNGAKVYMPVSPDRLRQQMVKYAAAGLLVEPPLPEERELLFNIGAFVVRLHTNDDGSETPVVDLYFRHPNGYFDRKRSTRVYLNNDYDVRAFERAFAISLDGLEFYSGQPITRGKNAALDHFVHQVPRGRVWGVFRPNPNFQNGGSEGAPKYYFVRWEVLGQMPLPPKTKQQGDNGQKSQKPQQQPQHQATDQAPEPQPQATGEPEPKPEPQPQDTGEAEPEPQPQAAAANAEERYHFSTKPIVAAVSKVWEMPPAKVVPALYKAFGNNGQQEITVAQAIAWAQSNRPAAA